MNVYLGLVPKLKESGDSSHAGHINRASRKTTRTLFTRSLKQAMYASPGPPYSAADQVELQVVAYTALALKQAVRLLYARPYIRTESRVVPRVIGDKYLWRSRPPQFTPPRTDPKSMVWEPPPPEPPTTGAAAAHSHKVTGRAAWFRLRGGRQYHHCLPPGLRRALSPLIIFRHLYEHIKLDLVVVVFRYYDPMQSIPGYDTIHMVCLRFLAKHVIVCAVVFR